MQVLDHFESFWIIYADEFPNVPAESGWKSPSKSIAQGSLLALSAFLRGAEPAARPREPLTQLLRRPLEASANVAGVPGGAWWSLVEPGLGWSCPSSKNGGLAQNFTVRTVETIVIHSARIGNRPVQLFSNDIPGDINGHNMAINAEKHYFQKHPGDFWWSVPQLKVGESNQQATSIEPAHIPMVECRNKDMNICGCEHIIPCTNWDPINSANLQKISYWQLYIWSGHYAQIELESWKLGGK